MVTRPTDEDRRGRSDQRDGSESQAVACTRGTLCGTPPGIRPGPARSLWGAAWRGRSAFLAGLFLKEAPLPVRAAFRADFWADFRAAFRAGPTDRPAMTEHEVEMGVPCRYVLKPTGGLPNEGGAARTAFPRPSPPEERQGLSLDRGFARCTRDSPHTRRQHLPRPPRPRGTASTLPVLEPARR